MEPVTKRPRISLDIGPETRRRLRLAAAKRDLTVRQYALDAIGERLREDLGEGGDGLLALTAQADPVLAALWVNPRDAVYDRLYAGGDIALVDFCLLGRIGPEAAAGGRAGRPLPSVATGILRPSKRTMIDRKLGTMAPADLTACDGALSRSLGL
jgi:hypothetical protein